MRSWGVTCCVVAMLGVAAAEGPVQWKDVTTAEDRQEFLKGLPAGVTGEVKIQIVEADETLLRTMTLRLPREEGIAAMQIELTERQFRAEANQGSKEVAYAVEKTAYGLIARHTVGSDGQTFEIQRTIGSTRTHLEAIFELCQGPSCGQAFMRRTTMGQWVALEDERSTSQWASIGALLGTLMLGGLFYLWWKQPNRRIV